ncbi:hypothetical protein K431DRAFT_222930 [Polychaeton citri CBS 116435]|uniref:F-box domain-containing protein n=1 Tax=Polychaeton citri CBS 116435 TaxID=1314669 RepID=A0A9P4UNA3_9PEZI|nr:hypothetical protein K431DRAFT_222930 [Polychaeton citri CBS 116435]
MSRLGTAAQVFAIPELLELILLALPLDKFYEEIESMRLILTSQAVCRTWRNLVIRSTPIRQMLYLPTPCDAKEARIWWDKTSIPPARPNPWIPHVVLNRRSWGSAYPFDNTYSAYNLDPSRPKLWTFALEISRADYERFPTSGDHSWWNMLLAKSPFVCMWYTRALYELGSGRAPFVTYLDYIPNIRKHEQKYVKRRKDGITLGDLVEAVSELFVIDGGIGWVRVESVRQADDETGETKDPIDRLPATRDLLPIASAQLWSEHFEQS